MLVYEYKVDTTNAQYARMDEAIRVGQFIRNKCVRLWMDGVSVSANDLQVYCSQLAKDFPFCRLPQFAGSSIRRRQNLAGNQPLLPKLPGEKAW